MAGEGVNKTVKLTPVFSPGWQAMWQPSHDHPGDSCHPITALWLAASPLSLVDVTSLSPPSGTVSEIHVILAHWSTKWRGLTKVWVLWNWREQRIRITFSSLLHLSSRLHEDDSLKSGWSSPLLIVSTPPRIIHKVRKASVREIRVGGTQAKRIL